MKCPDGCTASVSGCCSSCSPSGSTPTGGDSGWLDAHGELRELHFRKSATYGNDQDPLGNFTAIAEATGRPAERYVWERIMEKTVRALNMIDRGLAAQVKEAPDVASLALCAEALRRRV